MKLNRLFIALLFPMAAHAASENGTGAPNINVLIGENQRIALSVQDQGLFLHGSGQLQLGTTQIVLDALAEEGLVPDAARAELILSCDLATVIIYQTLGDELLKVDEQSIPLTVCH